MQALLDRIQQRTFDLVVANQHRIDLVDDVLNNKPISARHGWYIPQGRNPISTAVDMFLDQASNDVFLVVTCSEATLSALRNVREEANTPEVVTQYIQRLVKALSPKAQSIRRETLKAIREFSSNPYQRQVISEILEDHSPDTKLLVAPMGLATHMFPKVQTAAFSVRSDPAKGVIYQMDSAIVDLRSCPFVVLAAYWEMLCFGTSYCYLQLSRLETDVDWIECAKSWQMTQLLALLGHFEFAKMRSWASAENLRMFLLFPFTRKDIRAICGIRQTVGNWDIADIFVAAHAENLFYTSRLPPILEAEFYLAQSSYVVGEHVLLTFVTKLLAAEIARRPETGALNISPEVIAQRVDNTEYVESIQRLAPSLNTEIVRNLVGQEHAAARTVLFLSWRLLRYVRLASIPKERLHLILPGHPLIPAWVAALALEIQSMYATLTEKLRRGEENAVDEYRIFEDTMFDAFRQSSFAKELMQLQTSTNPETKEEDEDEPWSRPVREIEPPFDRLRRPALLGKRLRNVWPIFKATPRPLQHFITESHLINTPDLIRAMYNIIHAKWDTSPSLSDNVVECKRIYSAHASAWKPEDIYRACSGLKCLVFVWLGHASLYSFLMSCSERITGSKSFVCDYVVLSSIKPSGRFYKLLQRNCISVDLTSNSIRIEKHTVDFHKRLYTSPGDVDQLPNQDIHYLEIFSLPYPCSEHGVQFPIELPKRLE